MLHVVPAFQRIGEENAFAVLAKAAALSAQGRDIINLGIGQPDFKTPPHIVEAAIKALRDGEHGYTAANGILPLREAVAADLHKRHGVEVSPDSVLIVPGGKVTMFMAILMFGAPGVDILYPDPGFPIYRSMIEFTGARPMPIPMREENGFAFSAEESLALMTPATRLVILNSPANPTGGVTPKAEIDKLVAGLAALPRRRDPLRRNLRADDLRRARPPDPARLSRNPRPADPARRLVEDLRDDGVAARLLDLAGDALRRRAKTRGQFLFLRQCADPIRRPRRADRPAGRRARDGSRIRRAPTSRGGGAQRDTECARCDAERRVLRVPQHRRDRLEGEAARQCAAGKGRRR